MLWMQLRSQGHWLRKCWTTETQGLQPQTPLNQQTNWRFQTAFELYFPEHWNVSNNEFSSKLLDGKRRKAFTSEAVNFIFLYAVDFFSVDRHRTVNHPVQQNIWQLNDMWELEDSSRGQKIKPSINWSYFLVIRFWKAVICILLLTCLGVPCTSS